MQTRYFALKLPIALDAKAATLVYVDPGLTTDSELRARTFAVQIVAIGTGAEAVTRADKVLRSWTRDGDHRVISTVLFVVLGLLPHFPEFRRDLHDPEPDLWLREAGPAVSRPAH